MFYISSSHQTQKVSSLSGIRTQDLMLWGAGAAGAVLFTLEESLTSTTSIMYKIKVYIYLLGFYWSVIKMFVLFVQQWQHLL